MQDRTYLPFTEKMKKDYTILVPNMLPLHFKLIMSVMKTYGYNMELLETDGPQIAETGLKYTHNDTCYPAILVIGQFMDALLSGKYDTHKVALIMFQTGGGCRASNYISLIRKALAKAGMDYIPVISMSFSGLEKHPGFKLKPGMLMKVFFAGLCGDVMMSLVNQVRPYELNRGDAEALAEKLTAEIGKEMGESKRLPYKKVRGYYEKITREFEKIPMRSERDAVRVGIVGEIFVKYSPLANNDLERFLVSEGAEPVVPGLIDFMLYMIYNGISEYRIYKRGAKAYPIYCLAYKILCKEKRKIGRIIAESGVFRPWEPFENVVEIAESIISTAVKMGEGWLLTAEMLELAESGCKGVVCTQPFGCLPNHICGKGMMKPIKQLIPEVNIVAIDYDAGASRVNQENRLKLMLSNATKKTSAKSPCEAQADVISESELATPSEIITEKVLN